MSPRRERPQGNTRGARLRTGVVDARAGAVLVALVEGEHVEALRGLAGAVELDYGLDALLHLQRDDGGGVVGGGDVRQQTEAEDGGAQAAHLEGVLDVADEAAGAASDVVSDSLVL